MPTETSLSVIVGVKDGAATIARALESVISQRPPECQLIVIDGDSTDGTQAIVEKYREHVDYFLSEPDACYAEAWNKGLAQARGDLVMLLNADDYFPAGQLDFIARNADPDALAVYYGDVHLTDAEDVLIRSDKGRFRRLLKHFGFGFMHTTCVVPKKVYEKVGRFSESYRYAADTDWLLRCDRAGVAFVYLGNCIRMSVGGLTDRHYLASFDEYALALRRNGYSRVLTQLARLLSRLKALYRRL